MQASLILTGHAEQPTPKLYTPEIEDNPHAENALQDLADVAMQLQEAIAAGHTDPGVLKVRHKLFSLSMGISCYTNIYIKKIKITNN